MAKDRSFAAKTAKTGQNIAQVKICPVCNSPVQAVKYIEQYKNEATGTIRFKDKMVGVCKCNEKDLIG
ncbi:MAG TPA: hypothetical protein PKN04_07015 [bacterium]|jgi:hypothetical protein|nr:hypothetical protein [bacterium]HNT65506.1 hypothetical protein [bacterium]